MTIIYISINLALIIIIKLLLKRLTAMKTQFLTQLESSITPTDLYIETSHMNGNQLAERFGKEVSVKHLESIYNAKTRYDRKEISDIINSWVMSGYCKEYCHADLHYVTFITTK